MDSWVQFNCDKVIERCGHEKPKIYRVFMKSKEAVDYERYIDSTMVNKNRAEELRIDVYSGNRCIQSVQLRNWEYGDKT